MAYGALSGDLFQMASGRRAGMQNQASGIQLPRVQAPSLINDDDDDKEKDQTAVEGIRTAGPAGMIKPGTDEDGQNSNASPMAAGPAGLSDMDSAIASVSNQFAIWFGDRYAFSSKEAETFRDMVAGSADPVDTAGRYIAATAIAKRTGASVDQIYPRLDMYAKYFTGDVYRPGDATFGEKMNVSFESIDIMDEMGRWMDMVQKNGFDDPDAMALESEIMQRQEAIGGIQNGIPKGFWDSVANDVIASLGYTMEAINYGAGASLATTAATAPGVAAVTVINPFAGIAVGSTAALLAGANGAVASFNRTRKLTEADTFWNMTHLTDAEGNLLPRDINAATLYAGINGNITGFLETMADGVISRGLGTFAPSVAKRFGIPNLSMKVLTDRGVSGAASRITYAGVDFLTGGLNEGFIQEAPEQLATSVLTAIYENTVGGTPDISVKKLASEYFSTAFRSTLVGLAYGGLGIPQSMAQYDQISLDLRRTANRTPSQEAFFETTEQMKPESVSKDDYDLARTRIFESAQRDKAAMAGMSVNASEAIAEEERYSTEDPVTGEERAKALPDGSVYRDPERNALYTESREENGRRAFYAGDPNTGAVYGRIGLSSDGEVLTVDDVRVRPGYEGIREEFVRSAISTQRTGESIVEWNPSTPGNRAVRDMLIQNNPRGADAGLAYGADLSVSQDHDIQGLSSSIRTAMPNLSREESVVAARLYTIADSDGSLSKLNNGKPVQQDASLSARYRGAADAAKAIIYAGQNADFSTFYHELFHVNAAQRPAEARQLSNAVRSSLADEVSKANLRKFIEESKEIWGDSFNADDVMEHLGTIAAGSDASSWTRAQFEDLARLAEAYATADNSRRTTLPEAIRNILRKIGEYMRKVYQTVTHTVSLPNEISDAYDAIMHEASEERRNPEPNSSALNQNRKIQSKEEIANKVRSVIDSGDAKESRKIDVSKLKNGKGNMSLQAVREATKGIRGTYTNKETGEKITFGRTSIGELARHDFRNDEHIASIFSIPEFIEDGHYLGTAIDNEGRVFSYYLSLFDYDGQQYLVRSVVRRELNDSYYDHKLTSLEKIKDYLSGGIELSILGLPSGNPSIIEDKRLSGLLQGNDSLFFQSAYHGSPHSFDRFSTDHIGTGEGMQAFGWGLYVSDLEEVGRAYADMAITVEDIEERLTQYRDNLAKAESELKAAEEKLEAMQTDEYWSNQKQYQKALKEGASSAPFAFIRKTYEGKSNEEYAGFIKNNLIKSAEDKIYDARYNIRKYTDLIAEEESFAPQTRNLYKIELPDDAKWLDWEGRASIRIFDNLMKIDRFRNVITDNWETVSEARENFRNSSGRDLYGTVSMILGSDKAASLILNELGYTGIRYPVNATSANPSTTDHNYVVFNADDIQIVDHLVYQDAKSPDTSDFTPEQAEKRERIAAKDDAFLDGEDNSYDDFYDEYEADMDAIETEQDADFYSRMYSEYEAETAAETSNTDASVTDEMHPDWKDDEVNVLPDGSVPETEAEYEEAIASEFIPDEMADRGDSGIDAAAEAEKAGPSRSSEGGLYLTGSGDPETTWSEFISSNKPDISYADAKTDAEKDEIFIRSLQDNDNLLRYLGIAAEAMFLNTSRLNGGEDGYYFGDQMQRERIKERVTNAITNTTIRNASLQAFRGQPLSGRMASMIRREMGENARLYRNIFSYMLRDDAMKPESLIKETRGLDIPSRETLDAMPIAELRRLAATAEDQSIIDEIENGTLKLRGGADEKRAAEISSALESLAGRIREDETAIREASAANSALQNDIDSLTASMSERDKAINETMRDLQDIDAALRSGIGKLSGEQLERLSYTPRMKEISGQLAWLSESRYSEYERQRTKGKKGKYEYPRAQKEARSEYLADLSRAIPGILDSLPSGIDPETRSGFSEARKVLDARMEELRGEWQNEAAGYIADLSGSVRRRSREISSRIDDAISRMDKLSREVKRQEKLRETVKSNRVRQIYDARTEERWKAAKKMLEREKELNQRIQDWKSFASYQRKELRSEARENARTAVDEAITRERWLSSKKLHEETAKLQQEINDWKSYAEWERKDRKAELDRTLRKAKDDAALLAAWMKAKGDERIKKLKEEQRAKRKEERLYRQIRAEKLKLARAISRPVNLNTTDFDTSAEAIMAIQAIVDPVFRRDWVYDLETDAEQLPGGDTMSIQNAVAYLEALSENDRASVLSVLSPELVARLTGTRNPLNDWSIAELRMLAEQVSELRRRGREVLAAKKAFERESIQRIQKSIIDAVRSTKDGDPGKSTLPGTLERMKQAQGPWANMRINKYVTMRMSELAQLLDGGLGRKGEAYHLLVDEKRYHQSREWEAADRRYSKAKPYLTKETLRNLFDTITVELDGIKRTYTIDQLCALVLTEGYADNVEAIMGGNLLDETEKGTATSHGYFDDEGKFHPEYMSPGTIADDTELENIAKSRYRKLLGIAHRETAARNLLPLIYEIRNDFNDPSNFDRLNRASIEWYNTPVKRVEGYFPIIRQDLKGESFRNDVADSIFNLNTNEANAMLDKGMTIERIHISLRHQRPVDISMLGVWQKAVRDQEHLIEYAGYHKKLKSVFGSNASELITAVNQAYSPALMKEVQDYIDHVIDPYAGGARSQTDKAMRNLRGRVGSAYLGWKLPGVVLQFCTSAWPFLQEMGPATMLRGYLRLASGRGDAFNFVMEKSPMMKHRTMNTVLQEAMERRGEVNTSKAGRALNKFEEIGQLGLIWVDKTIVFGGWLGAYEDALQRNLDAGMDTALADAAAVKTADDIVLNTQPVGDSTELPSLFRTKSEAMKIFLQFQSSLSVIWNNLVWDNIGYFRNREYGKIIRSVAAYSMAGLALGLVADGFDDDDDDADRLRKIAYWMMTQGIESFPVFGSDISGILQRAITGEKDFYGSGTDMFPGITKLFSGVESIIASDKPFLDGAKKVAEGAGVLAGVPTSGIKSILRIREEGLGALLGR